MRKFDWVATCLILAVSAHLASRAEAAELYVNGFVSAAGPTQYQGIWDQAGVGFGGANVSVLQAPNSLIGASGAYVLGNSLADDFTVGAGQTWQVTSLRFYAYQPSTASFPVLQADVQLTGSDPNGTVLQSALGVPVNQGPGGMVGYRVIGATLNSDTRPIWEIEVPLATAWTISSGHYFLRWSMFLNNAGNLIFPPIVPTNGGGNAQQSVDRAAFAPLIDGGSGFNVELPFMLVGTVVPEPSTVILSAVSGLFVVAVVRKKRLGR